MTSAATIYNCLAHMWRIFSNWTSLVLISVALSIYLPSSVNHEISQSSSGVKTAYSSVVSGLTVSRIFNLAHSNTFTRPNFKPAFATANVITTVVEPSDSSTTGKSDCSSDDSGSDFFNPIVFSIVECVWMQTWSSSWTKKEKIESVSRIVANLT
jgi:hypothetical protein